MNSKVHQAVTCRMEKLQSPAAINVFFQVITRANK